MAGDKGEGQQQARAGMHVLSKKGRLLPHVWQQPDAPLSGLPAKSLSSAVHAAPAVPAQRLPVQLAALLLHHRQLYMIKGLPGAHVWQ